MQRCTAMLAVLVAGGSVGEEMSMDLSKDSEMPSLLDVLSPREMQALDPATGQPPPDRVERTQPLDPALDPALAVPALDTASRTPLAAGVPGDPPPPQRRSLPPVPPPAPPGQMVLELMSKLRRDNDDYVEKGEGTRRSNYLSEVEGRRRADISSTVTQSSSQITESSSKVTETSSKVTQSTSKVTKSSSKMTQTSSEVTETSSKSTQTSSKTTKTTPTTTTTTKSSTSARTTQSRTKTTERSTTTETSTVTTESNMSNSSRRMGNTRGLSGRRRSSEPLASSARHHHHHNGLLGGGAESDRGSAGNKGAAGAKGRAGGKGKGKEALHPALAALLPATPQPGGRRPARRSPPPARFSPPAHRAPHYSADMVRRTHEAASHEVDYRRSKKKKQSLDKNELKKLVRLLSENRQMMAKMMVGPAMSRGRDKPRGVPRAGERQGGAGGAGELPHGHREPHSEGMDFTEEETIERPLHAAQLDLSPARGERIVSMRLKGRICQRNVVHVEGPKYNARGRIYQAEFESEKMGYSFNQTRLPKFIIPICCNCCTKSVLGCE